MQVHASLDDHQPKAATGNLPDIGAAMKRGKKVSLVLEGNPNPLVFNQELGEIAVSSNPESHRGADWGKFDGIAQ